MQRAEDLITLVPVAHQKLKYQQIVKTARYRCVNAVNLMPKHADWNIRFASNQLVLCYTDNSRFADEVNADNWTDILGRKGVVWGHSDPNPAPCGHRSLMVLQLADKLTAALEASGCSYLPDMRLPFSS